MIELFVVFFGVIARKGRKIARTQQISISQVNTVLFMFVDLE